MVKNRAEYNIYNASLDNARNKLFVFCCDAYIRPETNPESLGSVPGMSNPKQKLGAPFVFVHPELGTAHTFSTLTHESGLKQKNHTDVSFHNYESNNLIGGAINKPSLLINSNPNFFLKTPLLDSFLQFLFYNNR